MKGDANRGKIRDVIELVRGVTVSFDNPGHLEVSQECLDRILVREPIQKYYEVEQEPFARGKSAAVRRCRDRLTGRQYAAKFLKKRRTSPELRSDVLHEVAVLEVCKGCPRVVSLHQVFESSSETVLILELAHGGELQTLLDSDEVPAEGQVVRLMRQILDGIVFLHNINVAHLDLKPQNLVLTGVYPHCDVKLCDFGISRHLTKEADVREMQGTPDYVAPEVLSYEPISLASDMWSVGVLMYVLLTGCSPFGGDTKQETFCNITECRLDFPEELFGDISQEAQDLMTKLMVIKPSDRLTAKECLQHPWFTKDFSEPTTVPSSPIQRTPVPPRKEHILQKPSRDPTSETLLPIEENDNVISNNMYVERNSIKMSSLRLDNEAPLKAESALRLDNEQPFNVESTLRINNKPPNKVEPHLVNKSINGSAEITNDISKFTTISRNDSFKRHRARTTQTMPIPGISRSPGVLNINKHSEREFIYKCIPIYINDESDDYSPPSSISGSSSGSSINAVSDAPFGSDTNSDTVSDMSIDSSSDRSSIISLDDSIDYNVHGSVVKSLIQSRNYSSSCYNIWEATRNQKPHTRPLKDCSGSFAKARSKFSGLAEEFRTYNLAAYKLSVYNKRHSMIQPTINSEKTIALELRKEHNSNTVTIREVKPINGKSYARTSEVKCETVRSRIQKLEVYNSDRVVKEKYDVF